MSWIKHKISPNHKIYVPKNMDKFVGNYAVCRSSWEHKFCKWCDNNPKVVLWSSESVAIQYKDPVKKITRRYFPDFVVRLQSGKTYVVEIKPFKETMPPKMAGRKKKSTYIKENATYHSNQAKWRAAENYCQRHGYEFKVITEKALPV